MNGIPASCTVCQHAKPAFAGLGRSPIFLGDRPRGPIFGARDDAAPTSPPVARTYTSTTAEGSNLGACTEQHSSPSQDLARQLDVVQRLQNDACHAAIARGIAASGSAAPAEHFANRRLNTSDYASVHGGADGARTMTPGCPYTRRSPTYSSLARQKRPSLFRRQQHGWGWQGFCH